MRSIKTRLYVCLALSITVLIISLRYASNAVAVPDPAAIKVQGADTAGTPVQVTISGGSTPAIASNNITASATANGAGPATATLAGVAGKTTYITGFTYTASQGSGNQQMVVTVTGIIGGNTFTYDDFVTAASIGHIYNRLFIPPLPASAVNTAIVVTATGGASAGNYAVEATGFQQ